MCLRGLALPVVVAFTNACGSDAGADDDAASSTGTDTGADESESGGDPDAAAAMCMRWLADRADLSEGAWSGATASCEAGDIAADARQRALAQINLYRWLAELPEIETSAERDGKAQACALMMHANGTLSHTPPPEWACFTAEGSEAAGSSNIASAPAVAAIDLYMNDFGNPDTLGHRRWILSNSIGPTGIGSTDTFSCMWTLGGNGNAAAAWIAYPPPGPFPAAALSIGFASLDETGWSIQSDTIDLSAAEVEITRGDEVLPVDITVLASGYGSTFAISMIPSGWQAGVGDYHVRVTGVAQPIEYDVAIVDCTG
jgi:uncharacterized protein YkwD